MQKIHILLIIPGEIVPVGREDELFFPSLEQHHGPRGEQYLVETSLWQAGGGLICYLIAELVGAYRKMVDLSAYQADQRASRMIIDDKFVLYEIVFQWDIPVQDTVIEEGPCLQTVRIEKWEAFCGSAIADVFVPVIQPAVIAQSGVDIQP